MVDRLSQSKYRKTGLRRSKVEFALVVVSFLHWFALPALAQAPSDDKPIDIQAEEQEFAEDHVIARGKVRVLYKDSIVNAPVATLYRDEQGQPQKAVFTGHPHLIQGANKIDADRLVFEIANQRVVAEGNAHSEVMSDQSMKEKTPEEKAKEEAAAQAAQKKQAEAALKQAAESGSEGNSGEDAPDETASSSTGSTKQAAAKSAKPANKPPEKIITDADKQEYDRSTGRFDAVGHVRVKHGDISVKANKLSLVYGADGKPETAVFTGNVSATQNKNNTIADSMIYFLTTQRLQATGHVRSKVIQQKPPDAGKKGGPVASQEAGSQSKESERDKTASSSGAAIVTGLSLESKDPIYITSDTQDYSKETGLLNAEGNVKVYYGDTLGLAPKVVMVRDSEGRAEKVVFTGRSQISQPGKRWIGDRITMMVEDHRVLAEGNTKAFLLQTPDRPSNKHKLPNSPIGPDKNNAQPAQQTQVAGRKEKKEERPL